MSNSDSKSGKMEDDVCTICKGAGVIFATDDTVTQCVCRYRKLLKTYLGSLADAKLPSRSPLWSETRDLTDKNLMIEVSWETARGHLKWALGCKGPTFQYRLVTDQRLVRVYVGEEDNFSLRDLVGPEDIKLLIIRLGGLKYKNIAAPGVLHETLVMREMAGAPTWIINEPENFFQAGHLSWSQETENYIRRRFKRLNMAPKAQRRTEKHATAIQHMSSCTSEPIHGVDDVSSEPKWKQDKARKESQGSGPTGLGNI